MFWRRRLLSRFTVTVCESVAVVGDQKEIFCTGDLTVCSIFFFTFCFASGAAVVVFFVFTIVVNKNMEEVFAHEDEYLLAIFVVLGEGNLA